MWIEHISNSYIENMKTKYNFDKLIKTSINKRYLNILTS